MSGGSTFVVGRGTIMITTLGLLTVTGTIQLIETIIGVFAFSKLTVPESKTAMFLERAFLSSLPPRLCRKQMVMLVLNQHHPKCVIIIHDKKTKIHRTRNDQHHPPKT